MRSNYRSKVLMWAFVFHLALITSQESTKQHNICEMYNEKHFIIESVTCCELKEIEITPLQDTVGWAECAGQGTDDNENYTTTVWRMYTCTLGKLLPKDQKTINLKEFAKLRISNFTESVQKGILDKIKEDGKDSKEPWLSSDVQLTDYPIIDKLRIHYFNIEKDICGFNETTDTDSLFLNITIEHASSCVRSEETYHKGGDCCGDISLPIYISKFGHNMASNCNRTLKTLYEKITFKNQTQWDTWALEDTCHASCYLIEKKLLTIDQLINVQVKDTVETDEIVKAQIDSFFSKTVLKSAQDYVKKELNTTQILEWVKDDWGDKVDNPTQLYGCLLYHEVLGLARHAPKAPCWE